MEIFFTDYYRVLPGLLEEVLGIPFYLHHFLLIL